MIGDATPPELPPELVQDYLAGMRAVIGLLLALADRLSAAGNDREALAQLTRETHKIHGSAGSFGFAEASRLAAGMEVTVKDWASRPDDRDVDRGSLTRWFVTRIAEMHKLEVPRRAEAARPVVPPPRLILRRPSAPAPAAPVERPPEAPQTKRLVLRRPAPPLQKPAAPRKPAAPPSVQPKRPVATPRKPASPLSPPSPPPAPPAPVSARRHVPEAPPPPPPPLPPPEPPPAARAQELTWLVPPDDGSVELTSAPPAPLPPPDEAALPPAPQPAAAPEAPAAPPDPQAAAPAAQPPPAAPAAPPDPQAAGPATEPPPAAALQPVAPAATPASEARPEPAVPDLIVVEDDPALAELLAYGLRARGYRFLSYRNGRDALRDLCALDVGGTRPLVLLDVDLPGLDGYSVLDALQRDRPGVYRVVFTTVHGTEAEQLRGLEAGALDYLVKPISLRVALEKIRRWVGK